MPKIDNPIDETPDQPAYPGLEVEDTCQTVGAPDIQTLFAPNIVPVSQQPSNRIGTYTYFLSPSQPATRIVEAQPIGIASRVLISADCVSAAKLLLACKKEFITPAADGLTQSMTFPIRLLATTAMQPFYLEFFTTAEIWAACVTTAVTIEVNALVETYDIDLRDHTVTQVYPYQEVATNQAPW